MAPKAKAVAKKRIVVPAEMLAKKAELIAARAEAKRILKAVKKADAKEAKRRHKLNMEAASLPLATLRKVIQAKTDMPDLICPHCRVSLDCRKEMNAAFVAVDNGRAAQPTWPPKPLAAPVVTVSATGAGGGMAAVA